MTGQDDNHRGELVQASRADTGSEIRCGTCGEEEALHGKREGGYFRIKCHRCGNSWYRDPKRVCSTCGRVDLVPVAQAHIEKVSVDQASITKVRTVFLYPACDAGSI